MTARRTAGNPGITISCGAIPDGDLVNIQFLLEDLGVLGLGQVVTMWQGSESVRYAVIEVQNVIGCASAETNAVLRRIGVNDDLRLVAAIIEEELGESIFPRAGKDVES